MSKLHLDVKDSYSSQEYNKTMKDKPIMVLFYADYCGHCKDMKPEWNKFVSSIQKKYTSKHPPMLIASINNEAMPFIEGHKEIKGFPSIFSLKPNGEKHQEFNGSRTANDFEEFFETQSKSFIPTKTSNSLESEYPILEETLYSPLDDINMDIYSVGNETPLTITSTMSKSKSKSKSKTSKSKTPKSKTSKKSKKSKKSRKSKK